MKTRINLILALSAATIIILVIILVITLTNQDKENKTVLATTEENTELTSETVTIIETSNTQITETPDNNTNTNTQNTTNNTNIQNTTNNNTNATANTLTEQVINLVNQERAKVGAAPLSTATNLSNAASVRAQEIVSSFSHTRPNGSSFYTALSESGVSYSGAGENIAYGQTTPEQVMQSWMNSEGHRANILNTNFTKIGVGLYKNASGVCYWTQLFIK